MSRFGPAVLRADGEDDRNIRQTTFGSLRERDALPDRRVPGEANSVELSRYFDRMAHRHLRLWRTALGRLAAHPTRVAQLIAVTEPAGWPPSKGHWISFNCLVAGKT